MNVLGVIPARGGSKGIPRKNLAPLAGKPLLAWTAETALAAGLARVVLSTDDEEIASVGRRLGLETPFRRPARLATDTATTLEVVEHALRHVAGEYDAILILQPTNPLRTVGDVHDAIALMDASRANSVISVVDVREAHPWRMLQLDDQAKVSWPGPPVLTWTLRQYLPPYYLRDGGIYLTQPRWLLREGKLLGPRTYAIQIPPERSVRIDGPLDLDWAEFLIRQKNQLTSPSELAKKEEAGPPPRAPRRGRPKTNRSSRETAGGL